MLPQRREIASVVVCEDDTPTLELLCDNLVADRFGVLPAPSASDALRLCRYKQPDLMLLDLTLPDASGLDVLREIREADGVVSRFDPHRVFSKRELLGEVWGYRTPTKTRTLDSHASRLRRKLDPESARFVINCWGVGYRLLDG